MTAGGIVLAGGGSVRMGAAKASLEWHGSTLLRRTVGILVRAVDGPVVVVRAPGQVLPPLPADVAVHDDPREGLGPLQGLAVGLAALSGCDAAFACATDLPFLHPAFVRRLLDALGDAEIVLPVARGYPQPLAAVYRTDLAGRVQRLVDADRLRPAFLFLESAVRRLEEAALLADPALAAADPALESLVNVNEPAEYAAARARPAPQVTADGRPVRAAVLRQVATGPGVTLNGASVADGELPLVAGDVVHRPHSR